MSDPQGPDSPRAPSIGPSRANAPDPRARTQPATPHVGLQRARRLIRLQHWLETPMLVLAFVWLALFVVEMVWGLTPLLEGVGYVIWGLFVLDFGVGLTLAPRKGTYLRRNWLSALALLAPALRVLRVFRIMRLARAASVVRGARLVRVMSSLNRSMRALAASMRRRGLGYVVLLTVLVTVAGAGGMYAFENGPGGSASFRDFGSALWWTAMLMTTMGSADWPVTAAGRILCLLLALYAFGVFGYVTATLATFFIGRDAEDETAEWAGAKAIAALHAEIAALRGELQAGRTEGQANGA